MFTAGIGEYSDFTDLGQHATETEAYAAIGRYVAENRPDQHAEVTDDGWSEPRVWRLPAPPDDVDVLHPLRPRTGGATRWTRRADLGPDCWQSNGNQGIYGWDDVLSEGAVSDTEPGPALAPGVYTARLPIGLGGRVDPGPDVAAGEQIVLLEPGGGDTWHVMTVAGDRARASTRVLEGALLEGGARS